MNIQLDYPEIWAARKTLVTILDSEQDEAIDSLIDACFRSFASDQTRISMASSNYSRARALLHIASNQSAEPTLSENALFALVHALLAQIEEFKP